jgi:hypothetical protein
MTVGLDFDNTLVDYDRAAFELARARNWIPASLSPTKTAVRDCLRASAEGDLRWQYLQGALYTHGLDRAVLPPGVADCVLARRAAGDRIVIVSHKTEFAHHNGHGVNLREAALAWMTRQQFFADDGLGFGQADVYFAARRDEKIARIDALGCDWFVDDLPELFAEPAFPASTQRILYAPHGAPAELPDTVRVAADWPAVGRLLEATA